MLFHALTKFVALGRKAKKVLFLPEKSFICCCWMEQEMKIYELAFLMRYVTLSSFRRRSFFDLNWEKILKFSLNDPTENGSKVGCRHSSMDSSAPSNLSPRVRVPSIPSTLL